ncbi:MAG: hypothetical protein AAF743_00050 [Planctomycetota bacterium]
MTADIGRLSRESAICGFGECSEVFATARSSVSCQAAGVGPTDAAKVLAELAEEFPPTKTAALRLSVLLPTARTTD